MSAAYLIIVSEADPVAVRVAAHWGTPESTGAHVDGAPVRRLSTGAMMLRRPGRHIFDEQLDARLPAELREARVSLVFPSIHRSEQNVECLTVHPLGNPGPTAEVGGRPRSLVPTDPLRMTAALRAMAEKGAPLGIRATFEATHHGPELSQPAFFIEVGFGTAPGPSEDAVRILAEVLPDLAPEPGDRVALGVGGGHYAPHFTDLALRRRWAFGHLLSRHALGVLDASTAKAAWDTSTGAEGILYARAEDARLPALGGLGPRLRDGESPLRTASVPSIGASRSASGT
ncbi:MAG: D-aminoacyl-tRNA deacylase [Thermoplasmata archaeon]